MKRGTRYGSLTYLGPAPKPKFGNDRRGSRGRWRCECGTVRNVPISIVVNGYTRSCGCKAQIAVRGWLRAHRLECEANKTGAKRR